MRFYLIILAVFIYGCSPVFRYHLPTNPNGIDGITNEIKSVLVPSGYDFIPEGSNSMIGETSYTKCGSKELSTFSKSWKTFLSHHRVSVHIYECRQKTNIDIISSSGTQGEEEAKIASDKLYRSLVNKFGANVITSNKKYRLVLE